MIDQTNKPSPEEIQKEFEDFVKKRFGDQVQVVSQQFTSDQMPPQEQAETSFKDNEIDSAKEFDLNFRYKPRDIKKYLDRFVIKQDDAKKALAIAVCDHYNHVRECHENPDSKIDDYSKQNVLVLGPTGVGKTYLIKQIAKLIGVPFVKADATRFSETGYVGGNVDDLIQDLVQQADGNIELAQYGIVYLDEADKLAASDHQRGKDISGRGVQFGLLKLMEETDVDLSSGNDMRSQMQAFMEFQKKGKLDSRVINTRHILFIISGAFTGLTDLIKDRLDHNSIGFNQSVSNVSDDDNLLKHTTTQDLIDFGFEPEFVGRLPIRVSCEHLEEKDLFEILKNSEGSIIRQYIRAFSAYGIKANFDDDALQKIAEYASLEKTGARALMTVCERILRDFKYELPSLNLREFNIDKGLVEDPKQHLKKALEDYQPIADMHPRANEIEEFALSFFDRHHMNLLFTEDAINLICEEAEAANATPVEQCKSIFKSYEHGLKLVQQNSGQSEFLITKEVVKNPREALEKWIRESYDHTNSPTILN